MKHLYSIACILIVLSCDTARQLNISEPITYVKNEASVGSQLILHPDSTYEYTEFAGLWMASSTGFWKLDGNHLTLQTDSVPDSLLEHYRILEIQRVASSDVVDIEILGGYLHHEVIVVFVKENGELEGYSPSREGTISHSMPGLDSIIIKEPHSKTIRYPVQGDEEHITFILQDKQGFYPVFNNCRFVIQDGKVYRDLPWWKRRFMEPIWVEYLQEDN